MIRAVILAVAITTCYAATTTTSMPMTSTMPDDTTTMPVDITTMAAMQPEVLFDLKHHVAVIVRTTAGTSGNAGDAEGCYEYHMKHTDVQQVESGMTDAAAMSAIDALNNAASVHKIGHHQINHLTNEIQGKCASLPVFGFH